MPGLTTRLEPQALFARLADLRRRLRAVAGLRGLFWLAALLLGGVSLAGLLDYRLHLPSLARAVVLVGLLVGAGLIVWELLVRPLRQPTDDLGLALRVEAAFPTLNDALASTVQFLQMPDDHPAVGSATLRRETVQAALVQAEACNFRRLVNVRGLTRAGLGMACAAALALTLATLAPTLVRPALVRLADPFGNHPWPPSTRLEVVVPAQFPFRLARGEPFLLRANLSGVLPARATVRFAFEGGSIVEQTLTPMAAPGLPEGTMAIGTRLEPSQASRHFRLRIQANDADTGWQEVRVEPPPALVPLDGRPSPQTHLDFPAYTDLPAVDLPDGASTFEAVAGTRVRLRAATDRPIARASVVYRPESPRYDLAVRFAALAPADPLAVLGTHLVGDAIVGAVSGSLERDGRVFEIAFQPRLSGTYAVRFEDETGLGGTRLLEARILPDPPPRVLLDRPSAVRDGFDLLPTASFTLRAVIDDPTFAVRSAWLDYRCAKAEPPRVLRLFDHQMVGSAAPVLLAGLARSPALVRSLRLRPQQITAERRFALRSFTHPDGSPLKDGDVLTIQVAADDFDDVSPGKGPGRSAEVELRIVTPAALDKLIQQGQSGLRQEVLRLQQQQQEARQKVAEAHDQQRKTGDLRPADRERLLQAELTQQQVRSRVGTPEAGLRADVARMQQMLKDNDVPRSAAHDRLEEAATELERLAEEELAPIEPLLARARKEAAAAEDPNRSKTLAEALRHQTEAEQTLKNLLERLEPWSDAAEVRGEARSLVQEQRRLNDQTDKLRESLPAGVARQRLTPEQQAELDRVANRQERLTARIDQLFEKLARLTDDKGAKARSVHERLEEAERKEQQAADKEAQAKELPPERASERRALEQSAKSLRSDAQDLREAAAAAELELAALRKADEQGHAGDPKAKLNAAAESLRQNQPGKAREQQDEAVKPLERLIDALQDRPRDADLDRLSKKLREAHERLTELTEAQERLQKKVEQANQLTNPQERKAELDRLAREQEQLRQEARDQAERLSRLRAGEASQALSRAGRQMDQAKGQMDQGEPAEDTQDDALDRLDDAARALEQKRQEIEEELLREKITKLAEAVRGLKERQASAVAEGVRIDKAVRSAKNWRRDLQQSLLDLGYTEEALAKEVKGLAEQRFASLPVFERMAQQAAEAMERAVEQIRTTKEDRQAQEDVGSLDVPAHQKQFRTMAEPQRLALRRLEQMLDGLKPEELLRAKADKPSGGDGQPGGGQPGGGQPSGRGGAGDGVPPLAQLKALRALQAEVAEQTEQFAKDHPDASKLTEEEQDELDVLRKTQDEIAELFQKLTPEPKGDQP